MKLNDINSDDPSGLPPEEVVEAPVVKLQQASVSGQFGEQGVLITDKKETAAIDTSMFKVNKGFSFVDKKGDKTAVVNIDRVPCLMIPPPVLISVGNKEEMMYKHLKSLMNMRLSDKRAMKFFQGLVQFYQFSIRHENLMIVCMKPWHKAAVVRFLSDHSEAIRHIAGYSNMDQMAQSNMLRMAQQAAGAATGADQSPKLAMDQIKEQLAGMTQLSETDREQILGLIAKEQTTSAVEPEPEHSEISVGVLDDVLRRTNADDKQE